MNNTSVIQVRVSPQLKAAAERRANSLGLASVQEAVRVFLTSFSTGRSTPSIVASEETGEFVRLSPRMKQRYAEAQEDFDQNKNVIDFDDPQKALEWLNR